MEVVELLNRLLIEEDRHAPKGFQEVSDLLRLQVVLWEDARPAYADDLNHLLLLP